jgi:hypothetical protein
MKSVIMSVAMAALVSVSTPDKASAAKTTFDFEFQTVIEYPKELTEANGLVRMAFTVNEEGELKILEMNASSEELKEYVTEQVNKVMVHSSDLRIGHTYYYQMNFNKK